MYVDYRPGEDFPVCDSLDSLFLVDRYFGFSEEDSEQVIEYMQEFSEEGVYTNVRDEDIATQNTEPPANFR